MDRKDENNDSGSADLNNKTSNDAGLYRVCPSKLTKRELEDLYYTIFEANVKLNNSIKEKDEKIKMLTTKMYRQHSAQKVHEADGRKDCCVNTQNTPKHTKGAITELKRANERMADRIRVLNLKLAAVAKDPAKRSQSRNIRDSNNLKIAPKENRPVVEVKKNHFSVTQTELACDVGRECQENKSPTLMEELREKIATLEADLAKIQNEYSMRIDRLELEVQQYHIKCQHKEHVSEVKRKKHKKKAKESAEQSQHNKEINLEAQSKDANKILRTAAKHEACNKHTCTNQRRDRKDMRLKICKACECNRSIKIADDNIENRSYKDSAGVIGSMNDLDDTNLNVVDTTSEMLRNRGEIVTQGSLDTHKHDNKRDNMARGSLDTQRNEDEANKRSEIILEALDAYGDASVKKEGVAQESFKINRHEDVTDCTGEIKKRESLVACKHAGESNEESLKAQIYDHVSENKKECDIASRSVDAQKPEDDSYNKSAKVAQESLDTCLNKDKFSYNRSQIPTEAFDTCKCEDTTENNRGDDIALDSLDARGSKEESDNNRSEIVQESLDAYKYKRKEDNVVHEKEIIKESEKDAQARHDKVYDDARGSNDAQDVFTICTKCNRKYKIVSDSLDAPKHKDSDKYRKSSVTATQVDSNKTIPDSINVHQPKEVLEYIEGQVAPESVDAHRHEASFVKRNTQENRGDKGAPDKMNSHTHKDALEINFQEQNDTHDHKATNASNHDLADFKATHENQLPESSGLTHKDGTNAVEILPVNPITKSNSHKYKACKCECFKYINTRKGSSKNSCIDSKKIEDKCDDNCQKDEFDHKDINTLHKTDSKNAFNTFKSERMRKCNKCNEIIYGSESIDCMRSLEKDGVKITERNSQSVDGDCTTTPKNLCNDKLTNNSEIATKIVQDPMGQTITFTDACQVYTEKSYKNDFNLIGCQEKADTTKIKDSSSIKVPSVSARVIEEDTVKQKDVKRYDNLMNDVDATSTSNLSNTLEEFDTLRYGKDPNLKRTSYGTDVCMIRHTKSCTNARVKKKTIKGTSAEIQNDTITNEKVCGQSVSVIPLDTNEPPILADKGESQVSMSMKKGSDQDEPKILPNAFIEPETLVKNLVNINEEQMKTVKELEHQLDVRTTSAHQAMLEEAEDFNIDDSTSKHSLKETIGPVVKTESLENRRTSVTTKNDQHNSLQIPGPIPVATNSKKYVKKNMNKKSFRDNKKRQLTDLDKKPKVYDVGSQNNGNETKENIEDAKERVLATQTDQNISQNDKMTETVVENSNLIAKETYFCQSTNDALPKPKPSRTFDASASMVVHCSGIKTIPSVVMDEQEIQVTPNIEATEPRRISKDGELPMLTPLDVQTYRNQFGILCFKTTPAERFVCCPCVRQTLCEKQSKGNQTECQTQEIQTVNKIDQNTVTDQLKFNGMDDAESHVMTCTPPSSNTQHQQSNGNDRIPKESSIEQGTNMNTKNIVEPNNQTSSQNRDKYASGTLIGNDQCSISFTEMALNNKPNSRTAFKLDENGAPPSSDYNTDLRNTVSSDKVMHYIPSRSPSKMKSSLDNMTKKLHSLGDELTLCKELLLRQQSREERNCMLTEHQHSADISLLDEEPSHALRPGQAKHAITEKSAPRCIFTLHIGTVVLSDEAVLSTIDKSLVLRWKFYDQNVSMTRMTTRRVMFFDFSTEYDILMSEEFFDYMKREEMKIVMCELNDQQDAFATCALPLRDALLHTNRRVDMSLALVAGSRMIDARNTNNSSDLLDTGDEMGVIDLWCMLHADPKLLPIINRAIARPSPHQKKKSGESLNVPQMTEILEECNVNKKKQSEGNYNGKQYQLSAWSSGMLYQDIDNIIRDGIRQGDVYEAKNYMSHLTLPQTVPIDTGIPLHLIKEGKRATHSKRDGKENQTKTKGETSHGPKAVQSKHTDRRNLQQKPPAKQVLNSKALDKEQRDTEQSMGSQIDDQKEEGIFINEVIANIKTPEDMQKALKQNPENQSVHCVSRLPKMEDELLSQPQSSVMSSGHFRDSRDKKRSAKQRFKSNQQSSDIKRRDSDNSYLPPLLLPEDNSEKTSVPLRYQNIAKLYGAKLEQAKRQVTIVPKGSTKPSNPSYTEAEVPQKDEPDQDHVAADYFKEDLQITILWLALNEECEAMLNPNIQRVYVAYAFMGKSGADLETPFSLPKPKHHVDKCYFNFKKSFRVEADDIPQLGHMVRCRAHSKTSRDPRDCIVFSVVSEPPEDPLGMATCEDIGYAYLYFGDLLAYSAGSPTYTEVIPVTACGSSSICGVLAIRVDGLDILRRCFEMTHSYHVPAMSKY